MKNKVRDIPDRCRVGQKTPQIVALSFFTGAMGFDIGLKNTGIESLLACENDKACRQTITQNNPDIALIGDIWDYTADDIYKMAGLSRDTKVDIMFGGPPCQAFSTAGRQGGLNDPRGNVFLRYIDLIEDIRPTYIVIENVRGLLSAEGTVRGKTIKGGALLSIVTRLREFGYTLSFNLYNAANFGAAQIRERLIMIGYLGRDKVPYLTPTHSDKVAYGLPKWRTIREAFKRLPVGIEHTYTPFSDKRLYYYQYLKEGQNWRDLPVDMQEKALGKAYYTSGGRTGFYRRLSYDKPSPTLLTSPVMFSTALAHPTESRPLSIEEYSVIQGFPIDWVFCGSVSDKYRQIGNAVPIQLGEAIGKTILAHMHRKSLKEYPDFAYSRYKNTDDKSWEARVLEHL